MEAKFNQLSSLPTCLTPAEQHPKPKKTHLLVLTDLFAGFGRNVFHMSVGLSLFKGVQYNTNTHTQSCGTQTHWRQLRNRRRPRRQGWNDKRPTLTWTSSTPFPPKVFSSLLCCLPVDLPPFNLVSVLDVSDLSFCYYSYMAKSTFNSIGPSSARSHIPFRVNKARLIVSDPKQILPQIQFQPTILHSDLHSFAHCLLSPSFLRSYAP